MLYRLVDTSKNNAIIEDCDNLTSSELAIKSVELSRRGIMTFKPIPVPFSELKEKSERELTENEKEKLMHEFNSTLNFAQKNDIQTGKKQIRYKVNIGYHLVLINKEEKESIVSTSYTSILREKNLENEIKLYLNWYKKDITESILENEVYNFTKEEIEAKIDKMTKI